ncbi:E3 ubiquitin-protein ligase MGRN1,Probable E3 ubiquitin-protein ligase MGRN1,E3 ubiquitin ligase Rnf157,E3 ubiquitin ligase RNF157 [Acanthosepion pharaonis]|uniref:RING-type E3 ubiquitin transferase n=1 Tax=Acanthosepion pharaonis TaxID=158019 RepID=A0A812B1Q0_ACAPH|nr:E3 ubiquitin-protein ligase MGRN1,Probable E3 ubiquitin-protein ligase MGRN1,E3 ubiquitin ligase Rnf157,E3 ubiquitin ligase RNF157 [Sepia pharaonis]
MGALASRRNAGNDVVDYGNNNAYRYPPKSGSYFSSHFIMGGERFDMTQPEAYLFGENQDLNFLGNKPIPFPYPLPQGNEPTKTLKSLVNIRKDTLRFVRISDAEKVPLDNSDTEQTFNHHRYNIEFTFDSDVKCAITIYYFAMEEISNGQLVYHPRAASMNSETYHYKRGANQVFSQSTHVVDPSKFPEEDWQYNPDKEVIPVVIQCIVEEEEHAGHSHVTFAVVEKNADSGYVLKPLKQKQCVGGLCYLLQEIYGIENKNLERSKLDADDEIEDTGSECVICMSDMRDTLILPCRHLCLCNNCAESLRYQASNCPICRAPFRALLQIRAMRRKQVSSNLTQGGGEEDNFVSQEGVPPGYEAVSLLEALNGPYQNNSVPSPMQMSHEGIREKKRSLKRRQTNEVTGTRQQAQNLNDDLVDKENKTNEAIIAKNTQPTTPEVVMSEQIVGSQGNKENEKNSGSDVEAVPPLSEESKHSDKNMVSSINSISSEALSDKIGRQTPADRKDVVAADCETHSMERGEYLKLYEQAEQECESDYLRTCSQTTASSDNFLEDSTSCSDPDEAEPELDYDVEANPPSLSLYACALSLNARALHLSDPHHHMHSFSLNLVITCKLALARSLPLILIITCILSFSLSVSHPHRHSLSLILIGILCLSSSSAFSVSHPHRHSLSLILIGILCLSSSSAFSVSHPHRHSLSLILIGILCLCLSLSNPHLHSLSL